MDIAHLAPSEVDIECTVRGLSGNQKVAFLRNALQQEAAGAKISPEIAHQDAIHRPRLEVEICSNKINNLRENFRSKLTQVPSDANTFTIDKENITLLKSKLAHVRGRLLRLSTVASITNRVTYLLEVCIQLQNLFDRSLTTREDLDETCKIMDAIEIDSNDSIIEEENAEVQQVPPHSGACSTPHTKTLTGINNFAPPLMTTNTTMTIPQTNVNPSYTVPPTPPPPLLTKEQSVLGCNLNTPPGGYPNRISQRSAHSLSGASLAKEIRNLKFDGSVYGLNADRFIYRFELLAYNRGIPENMLIEEVLGFLEGAALEFYWSCREKDRSISWSYLRALLKDRFQSFNSDGVIRSSIEARKQRPGEPFIEFYNAILNLSAPLQNPLSQSELISLLTKNMRTSLQFQHASFRPTSVSDLVESCVTTENTWKRMGMVPDYYTPRRTVHELNETPSNFYPNNEFIYNSTSSTSDNSNSLNDPGMNNLNAIYNRNNSGSNYNQVRCWNCDGSHRFHDCELPVKGIFCFGCGKKDTLKPHCPVCKNKNSGNGSMGMRTLGNSHFQQPQKSPQQTPSTTDAAANTDPELYRRQLTILQRQH